MSANLNLSEQHSRANHTPDATNRLAGGVRLRYVDALRGLAATGVMIFHFNGHRICRPLHEQLPNWIPEVFSHGKLGVQVFFVISGFVIAYSLQSIQMNGRLFANFVLRRSVRLDPPYWVAIAAVVATAYLSKEYLGNVDVTLPTAGQIVAHALYIYQLLGYDDIYPVFWTLCHEVQFYLLFALLLGIGQILSRRRNAASGGLAAVDRSWVIVLFAVTGALSGTGRFQAHGLCLDTWYLFCLGVLSYGVLGAGLPWQIWLGYVIVLVLGTWTSIRWNRRRKWPELRRPLRWSWVALPESSPRGTAGP